MHIVIFFLNQIQPNSTFLDFVNMTLSDNYSKIAQINNLSINTDYRCIKSVADKPISDVLPINRASLVVSIINSSLISHTQRYQLKFSGIYSNKYYKIHYGYNYNVYTRNKNSTNVWCIQL